MNARSEEFMRRAIELSRNGFPAPNPRVGCVIAKDGEVVGEGWCDFAGGPHAEAMALAFARENASGADVFVTLEPCNHQGRTPPCSRALIEAGVRSVTVAVCDPNPIASGGLDALRSTGIRCEVGLLQQEAAVVNFAFLTAMRRKRPYVVAKVATTGDGFIARPDGSSKWITGELARAEAHRLRAEMGCVLVGSRTVEIDDPQLTSRIPGVVNQPLRVVIDPRAGLDGKHRVFEGDAETIRFVATGNARLPQDIELNEYTLDAVLSDLFERGQIGVLVEGGAETLASFFREGLVDRLEKFTSPTTFGEGLHWLGADPPEIELEKTGEQQLGEDLHETFKVVGRRNNRAE